MNLTTDIYGSDSPDTTELMAVQTPPTPTNYGHNIDTSVYYKVISIDSIEQKILCKNPITGKEEKINNILPFTKKSKELPKNKHYFIFFLQVTSSPSNNINYNICVGTGCCIDEARNNVFWSRYVGACNNTSYATFVIDDYAKLLTIGYFYLTSQTNTGEDVKFCFTFGDPDSASGTAKGTG